MKWMRWSLRDWFVVVTLLCINLVCLNYLIGTIEAFTDTVDIMYEEFGAAPVDDARQYIAEAIEAWRFRWQ